jgi:hypothetical protein
MTVTPRSLEKSCTPAKLDGRTLAGFPDLASSRTVAAPADVALSLADRSSDAHRASPEPRRATSAIRWLSLSSCPCARASPWIEAAAPLGPDARNRPVPSVPGLAAAGGRTSAFVIRSLPAVLFVCDELEREDSRDLASAPFDRERRPRRAYDSGSGSFPARPASSWISILGPVGPG